MTVEDFLELEKSGSLLESGMFHGMFPGSLLESGMFHGMFPGSLLKSGIVGCVPQLFVSLSDVSLNDLKLNKHEKSTPKILEWILLPF